MRKKFEEKKLSLWLFEMKKRGFVFDFRPAHDQSTTQPKKVAKEFVRIMDRWWQLKQTALWKQAQTDCTFAADNAVKKPDEARFLFYRVHFSAWK